MPLIRDGRRLALLKRSVGRDHAVPRPLSPLQVAECLEEMKSDLADPAGRKTARRLGVSASLVSDFAGMISLPRESRRVLGWGPRRKGSVPWSAFRRAGPLLRDGAITQDDFWALLDGVLQGRVPASAVGDILQLKKKNPDRTAEECRREIMNAVPARKRYVVLVSDLDPDVEAALQEAASAKAASPDALAESALSERLGGGTEGVLIKDGRIKVALTGQGRSILGDEARGEKAALAGAVNRILRDALGARPAGGPRAGRCRRER